MDYHETHVTTRFLTYVAQVSETRTSWGFVPARVTTQAEIIDAAAIRGGESEDSSGGRRDRGCMPV